MKRLTPLYRTVACIGVFMLLPMVPLTQAQSKATVLYEGKWEIQPNGDVKVTRQYKLPMQYYRMWKDADMHMLEFRSFSPDRSAVEVADMEFAWDDMARTLTLSMNVLGLAINKGDHWEAEILPGEEFSNLDETKKIAYFHFSMDGPMGRIQGQDSIVLSPNCTHAKWDAPSRTISYEMPEFSPAGSKGLIKLWWVLCVVCFMGCIFFWVKSFTDSDRTKA